MFVDTMFAMLDDVPKISQFRFLSFPSAPSTQCRVFSRAFSAVQNEKRKRKNQCKYDMAGMQ